MLLLHISCFILTITLVQSQLYDKNQVRTRRGGGFMFPDDNPTSNEQPGVSFFYIFFIIFDRESSPLISPNKESIKE